MAYRPDPRTPTALPLSGVYERMLRDGGHYKPRADLYLSKGRTPGAPRWQQGIPRSPRVRSHGYDHHGDGDVEPDPNLSNDKTTGQLVRRMLLKSWNREQMLTALLSRHNLGGAWLRFQRDPEDTLDRFVAGARLPKGHRPADENPPINGSASGANPPISQPGNPPIPPPEGETGQSRGVVIVPGIVELFLAYAQAEPRSRTDFMERGPLKGSRGGKGMAAAYVDHLTEQGQIRWVPGWRTKPRGPIPKTLAVVVPPPCEDLGALMAFWLAEGR